MLRSIRWLWVGLVVVLCGPWTGCSASDSGKQSSGGSSAGGASGSGASSGFGGLIDGGGATSGSAGSGGGATLIDECPGPLDAATAAALQAGGTADPAMRWLYPFDRTVFPRGLQAPVLQWDPAAGAPPSAIYLHLKSTSFEYKGCFGPANPARLPIPQQVWIEATSKASGPGDPLLVELTTQQNGSIAGPISEKWVVAPATLKGAVFYNTYGSPQVGNNGAVMRILPGQPQPQPFLTVAGVAPLGPCMSCHALSANGQSMVAAKHQYPTGPYQSFSYDLKSNPSPNPPPISPGSLDAAAFAAVFPDGSRFMTMGSPGTTNPTPFPNGPGNVVGMEGPRTSKLFAINGTPLSPSGWNIQYAKMPMFSPDGKKIVFNHHEASNGHTLAVMDFDAASNAFSGYAAIYQDPTRYPGWPFFTPDGKGVVFALGDAADYVGAHPARPQVAHSDLWYVDLASKVAVPLAQAGGFDGATSYLPYPGRDEHYEFFPTVSPVAAGGYFWLFFTSRRNYGNTIVGAVDAPPAKKIWVTALDIDAASGTDPSHPAFYLPGQELDSGNVRAFAALEPCRENGAQCASGIDCCCGACLGGVCGCPEGCSKIDEKCTTAADCCDPAAACIGGFCALVVR